VRLRESSAFRAVIANCNYSARSYAVIEGQAMIDKKMNSRAERREEIKLMLEYAKVVFSVVGVATIIFAGLQWKAANNVADTTVY
jgi:hypothetical protein